MSVPVLTTQEYPTVPEGVLRVVNDLARALGSKTGGPESSIVTVTVDEAHTFPLRVKSGIRSTPAGVAVVGARDLTAKGQPPASVGSAAWSASGDTLLVTSVSGITPGHSYRLSLLVLGS